MLKCRFKHFGTIFEFSKDFRRHPKTSEDFQNISKIAELIGMLVFAFSGAFSQVFQRISKHSTKDIGTLTSGNWPTVKFYHVCY